jgi:hypothetical protein
MPLWALARVAVPTGRSDVLVEIRTDGNGPYHRSRSTWVEPDTMKTSITVGAGIAGAMERRGGPGCGAAR